MNAVITLPFPRSYWVVAGKLLAGCYPGDKDPGEADRKLRALIDVGIRRVINLMEEDEKDYEGKPFSWYRDRLGHLAAERGVDVSDVRVSIRDYSIPSPETMRVILGTIETAIGQGQPVYVHCWGGRGRTATVIGCYLIEKGLATPNDVLDRIDHLRSNVPDRHKPAPETAEQGEFVRSWKRKGTI